MAGYTAYDADAKSYRALAGKVARSGADGVLIAGTLYSGGDRVLTDLRARLGPRIAIMTGHELPYVGNLLARSGDAARGLYFSDERLFPATIRRTPASERFNHDFGAASDGSYALQTAQAVETALHAIARSDGTRASVLRQLHATRVTRGILGSFHLDRYGDMTPAKVMILRITGTTPAGVTLPSDLEGAVIDRVETVPASGAG